MGYIVWSFTDDMGAGKQYGSYNAFLNSFSPFDGRIDDIRIFDEKALSASEVSNIYNESYGTPAVPTATGSIEPESMKSNTPTTITLGYTDANNDKCQILFCDREWCVEY